MKKFILGMIACIMVLFTLTVPTFAAIEMPQVFSWEDDIARDFNGNPVTDCWAYDPSQPEMKYVKLDKDGKLIEQKATYEVVSEEKQTGWIKYEAILPDELKGYTVNVSITGPETYNVSLYDINDYTSMQEVVAGTYKIDVAMIAGDYKNEYPSTFEEEITVYPNSTAAVLSVDFTPQEEVKEEEPEETTEVVEEVVVEEKGFGVLQIVVITILVLIAGAGIFVFKKIKDNE